MKKPYKRGVRQQQINDEQLVSLSEIDTWMDALGIEFSKKTRFLKGYKPTFNRVLANERILLDIHGNDSIQLIVEGKTTKRNNKKIAVAKNEGWRIYIYNNLNYRNFIDVLEGLV